MKRSKAMGWTLIGLIGWMLVVTGIAGSAVAYEKRQMVAEEGGWSPWGPCVDNDGDGIVHCVSYKYDDYCKDDPYWWVRDRDCIYYGPQPPGYRYASCKSTATGYECLGDQAVLGYGGTHQHYETIDP